MSHPEKKKGFEKKRVRLSYLLYVGIFRVANSVNSSETHQRGFQR